MFDRLSTLSSQQIPAHALLGAKLANKKKLPWRSHNIPRKRQQKWRHESAYETTIHRVWFQLILQSTGQGRRRVPKENVKREQGLNPAEANPKNPYSAWILAAEEWIQNQPQTKHRSRLKLISRRVRLLGITVNFAWAFVLALPYLCLSRALAFALTQ